MLFTPRLASTFLIFEGLNALLYFSSLWGAWCVFNKLKSLGCWRVFNERVVMNTESFETFKNVLIFKDCLDKISKVERTLNYEYEMSIFRDFKTKTSWKEVVETFYSSYIPLNVKKLVKFYLLLILESN